MNENNTTPTRRLSRITTSYNNFIAVALSSSTVVGERKSEVGSRIDLLE